MRIFAINLYKCQCTYASILADPAYLTNTQEILSYCRDCEQQVQSIAQRALGVRATLVHVFPALLAHAATLSGGELQPASHEILLAAQVFWLLLPL